MEYPYACTIGLGSNTPDREAQIKDAIDHICDYLSRASVSTVYESPAINGKDAPYLNAVIHGLSPVGSPALISFLKEWERDKGCTESAPGEVPIDLDLVIFNSRILRPKDFERHYFNRGYRELLANGAFLIDN